MGKKTAGRKLTGWDYIGEGSFIPGIPARFILLTEAKFRNIKAIIDGSPLYKRRYEEPKEGS